MKNVIPALILLVNLVPAFAADKRAQPVLPGEAKPIPNQVIVPAPVARSATASSSPIQQVIRAQQVSPSAPIAMPVPVPSTTPQVSIPSTSGGCASCAGGGSSAISSWNGTGHGLFGSNLREQYLQHICAPDGCLKPIGCGNFWTTKKFIFGSCRQFFGTAESAEGHHKGSFVR